MADACKTPNAAEWVDLKNIALLGIPLSTLKYKCKKGEFVTRRINGRGGERYQIEFNSLPIGLKTKLYGTSTKDCEASLPVPFESDPETESNLIAAMTEWEQGFVSKLLISFIRKNDITIESLSILKNIIDSLMSIISDHSSAEGKNV